jgi:hypothetical protein
MAIRFRWHNFRRFVDTGPVELAPVTLLIGANSGGKTSLHAPLLLLKQTLDARDPSIGLITRGRLVNVGSYADLIYRHDVSTPLRLELRWDTEEPEARAEPGRIPPVKIDVTFNLDEESHEVRLDSYQLDDAFGRTIVRRRRRRDGSFSLGGLPALGKSEAATAIRRARPRHFLFTGAEVFTHLFSEREARGEAPLLEPPVVAYLAPVSYSEAHIERVLEAISYVGPLRERPRRRYQLSDEMPPHVGVRGQYAPEILVRNRGTDLLANTERWLAQFGAGDRLEFAESDDTFAVTIRGRHDPPVNLADTGFGVSQVLPLIVQGFTADAGGLVIAEQPEIHLNPKFQALLANLFVDIAKRDVGVVVETHSEHLLLRLRTLVAAGEIDSDDVAIYYVEKKGRSSDVRRVPMTGNGHIDPELWPKDFFSESLTDSLRLAQLQRSRAAD